MKDFEESNIERLTCTGIASAVDRVLSTARALKEVRGLSRSGPLSREMPAHTANELFMTDGSQYVLDFHASLDIHAPMISTAADWLAHKKGWRYREDGTIPSLITFLRDDPAPDGID